LAHYKDALSAPFFLHYMVKLFGTSLRRMPTRPTARCLPTSSFYQRIKWKQSHAQQRFPGKFFL